MIITIFAGNSVEQVVPGPDFTAGVKNVTVPEGRLVFNIVIVLSIMIMMVMMMMIMMMFQVCMDTDECALDPGLCRGGLCVNTPGSWRCQVTQPGIQRGAPAYNHPAAVSAGPRAHPGRAPVQGH